MSATPKLGTAPGSVRALGRRDPVLRDMKSESLVTELIARLSGPTTVDRAAAPAAGQLSGPGTRLLGQLGALIDHRLRD